MPSNKQVTNDIRLVTALNLMVVGLAELDKLAGADPTKNPATVMCVGELNRRIQKYADTDLRHTFIKRVQQAKKKIAASSVVTDADAELLVVAVMRLLSSDKTKAKAGTALGFISSQFGRNVELLESKFTDDQVIAAARIQNRVHAILARA